MSKWSYNKTDSSPSFFTQFGLESTNDTSVFSYAWKTSLRLNSSNDGIKQCIFAKPFLIITFFENHLIPNVIIVSCESFKTKSLKPHSCTEPTCYRGLLQYLCLHCPQVVHTFFNDIKKLKTTNTHTHFIIHILIVKY
uniref:(northern house mosquito) hypothetical protein n=1 Tax=Culex pipiens TaxID=7175 RepID=A0A8D8JHV2_CULPI